MKYSKLLTGAALALVLVVAGPAWADCGKDHGKEHGEGHDAEHAKGITLEGEFIWARDDGDSTGPLRAVFTRADHEHAWTVSFHFDWEGEPHTYSGTATGDLKSGSLEGEVEADGDQSGRSFRFSGSFEDGMFSGEHGGVRDGEFRPTGTLTLAAN